MTNSVTTTGIIGNTYKGLFRKQILRVKPPVVGLAVAYVSASGFSLVKKILDDGGVDKVRLVTDTKDGVTHPRALQSAVDCGWGVRIVNSLGGTFHPKLYVGAAGFDDDAGVTDVSLAITGSPNISRGGFLNNAECVFWSVDPHSRNSAAKAWLDCWNAGVPVTTENLVAYEKYFALRNRYRKPEDIVALGIADRIPAKANGVPKKGVIPPKSEHKAISETAASVAWTGLQSFTGEYNLQVEFPKQAGLVLRRMFENLSQNESIDIVCSDCEVRTFSYRFYEHNGMFRLNIPNSTPLVPWAREHKQGIVYVEFNEQQSQIYFEIIQSGQLMLDILDRSLALGTWGRTPTRLYGWY